MRWISRRDRKLTERLELPHDALPAGGNWYPEDSVLGLLVDLVEAERPAQAVCCGGGLAVPVLARALARLGAGHVTVLEHDLQVIDIVAEMLATVGAADRATLLEAELSDYDAQTMWYNAHARDRVPGRIDLLFIDGPPHFAGRAPRWPAGPELFGRLAAQGIVLLDDARRVKERKALKLWAERHPEFDQTETAGGTVTLRRRDG